MAAIWRRIAASFEVEEESEESVPEKKGSVLDVALFGLCSSSTSYQYQKLRTSALLRLITYSDFTRPMPTFVYLVLLFIIHSVH